MIRKIGLGLCCLLWVAYGWGGVVSCGPITAQQEGKQDTDSQTETGNQTEQVVTEATSDTSVGKDDAAQESSGSDASITEQPTPTETVLDAPGPGAKGKWESGPNLPEPQQETAVVALGGEIYVIGGINGKIQTLDKVIVYNPTQKKWRSVASLPQIMHHANAAVYNGKIYVIGSLSPTFQAQDGVYVYDPKADKWTTLKPMPRSRMRGSSAIGTIGDKIYIAGGLRRTALTECDAYDPKTEQWTTLAPLPSQLDHMAGGVINGKLYIAGGRDTGITSFSRKSYVYDPGTNKWSEFTPIPTLRGGVAAAVYQGRLYVFGGEGNPKAGSDGVFAQAEVYDPTTNQWTSLNPMPRPVHGTGAATVGDRIYVPGGATKQAFGATDIHAVFLPGSE